MYLKGIKNKIRNLLYTDTSPKDEFVPYKKHFSIFDVNFDFWIADKTGQQWYDHNFWSDAPEFQMLNKMLNSDDHVLEFGLHHGFSSTFMSKKVADKGKYIGIELLPKAALYTMSNMKLNEIGPNCRIINAAGGDKPGKITFSNEESGNGFIVESGNGLQIEQITGDSLLPELDNKVNCLKIDVEGFEIKVLEGCRNILDQLPEIDIEIHPESIKSYGNEVFRIFELIDIEKYDAYYFWNQGTQYINPTSHKINRFSKEKMPQNGIINLFLFSKA